MEGGGIIFLILHLLAFFAIMAASSLAGVFVAARLAGRDENYGLTCAIGVAIGPAFVGWLIAQALLAAPGHDAGLYLGIAWCVAGAGAILALLFERQPLLALIGAQFARMGERPLLWPIVLGLWLLVALGLGGLAVIGVFAPLYGNDPLEYASASRAVYEAMDLNIYPIVSAETANGIFAGWSHPPGYIGMMVLAFLVQGGADQAGMAKLIAPYFAGAEVLLLAAFVGRARPLAAPLCALVLLGTPMYLTQTIEASIDLLRITTFTAAVLAFWLIAQKPTWGRAVLAGVALGMAHYSHSIGLLTLGFALPLCAIAARGPALATASRSAMAAVLGGLIVAPHLMRNVQIFGSVLHDSVPVWELPQLRFDERLSVIRFISTDTERWSNGVFRGFTQIELFGWAFWFLLACLLVAAFAVNWRTEPQRLLRETQLRAHPLFGALILVGGFFAFFGLTAIAGLDLAIKNPRYLMTCLPFVAASLALLVAMRLDPGSRRSP